MQIPTLYQLDGASVETGIVYHFCSQKDVRLFVEAEGSRGPFAEGLTARITLRSDAVCAYCGVALGGTLAAPVVVLTHLRNVIVRGKAAIEPGIYHALVEILDHALQGE
jgi:hypothetical protein